MLTIFPPQKHLNIQLNGAPSWSFLPLNVSSLFTGSPNTLNFLQNLLFEGPPPICFRLKGLVDQSVFREGKVS